MADTVTATTIVVAATAVSVQAASATRKTLELINTGAGDAYFGWSNAVNAAIYVVSTTIIAKQGT